MSVGLAIKVDPNRLLNTISASRLICFHECRLKFYFRYVVKIAKPKPVVLRVGSAVHLVLKAWNRSRWREEALTLKQLHDLYSQAWLKPDGEEVEWEGESEEEARLTGFRILETYIRQAPIPATEKPEAVEVSVEADLRSKGLPTLIGIIDLVRPPGRIVDYKTSGRTPDLLQSEHLTETQTTAYSVLYRLATNKVESAIEIHHLVKLKQPKVVVAEYPPSTERQRDRLFHLIESYVEGVGRADYVPSPGMQCASCEYLRECREWRDGNTKPNENARIHYRSAFVDHIRNRSVGDRSLPHEIHGDGAAPA